MSFRNVRCLLRILLTTGIMVFIAGCSQRPQGYHSVVGKIVRVDHGVGDHYSPAVGERPLTMVVVQPLLQKSTRQACALRIAILDIYSAAVYGQVGDRISFKAPPYISLDADIGFDQLADYHIVSGGDATQ